MQYTLKQLRYFVAIAEYGSISIAARNLYISQPALSAAIAQLESSLGISLLIRHHARGVSVTPAGRQFLTRARGLLGHAEELDVLGKELGNSVQGEIVIGCFVTLAPFFFPKLLRLLQRTHPELQVHLAEGALDPLRGDLIDNYGVIIGAVGKDGDVRPVAFVAGPGMGDLSQFDSAAHTLRISKDGWTAFRGRNVE